MSLRVLVFVWVAALLAAVVPAAAQIAIPPGWQPERAVVLLRDGVHAPVQSHEELDRHVATPWPVWPVPPGALTPRGAELLRLVGAYSRALQGGRGLTETDDCPPAGTVATWADTDQRSRDSGAALMSGMYPRCANLAPRYQADLSKPDPLFASQPSPSCPMDFASNRAALLARIGGDFSSVLREYAPQLSLMQATLCPPELAAGRPQCGLPSEAPAVQRGADGRVIIAGPIGIGSAAAEAFAMESAEGLPASQVAWGRLSGDAAIRDLLKIHRLEVDLAEKTLPIARQRGSNLLSQIVTTLQDGHRFPGAPNIAEPVRLAILIGHERNVAHIERLLNLDWDIPGYQANEAPPGSGLAFELFREVSTGQRYVRLAYFAQTPEQMRQATVLNLAQPPGAVEVDLAACAAYARERSCPMERFVEIAKAAIDPACVTIKP
jgi:4-phytase / acid phosphatase